MKHIVYLIVCSLFPIILQAQEEQRTVYYGKKYLDINIRSLNRLHKRIQRQQEHLLNKLSRKEKRLSRKLKRIDSAAYARLQSQSPSYDSIRILLHADSAARTGKLAKRGNIAVDSLKAVAGFIISKANTLNGAGQTLEPYTGKLNTLNTDLNYQQYIGGLIDQKSNSLKGISTNNIPLLTGMQKDLAYGKSKISEYKKMADDPSLLEEKALEWLQGTEGFDQALNARSGNSMQNATSADDLEKMGFQTKRQLNAQLQQKFGSSLGNVQQQMGEQVKQFTANNQQLAGVQETGNTIKETKQSLKDLKHTRKLELKLNPMRGLPFWKRIEKQYNFQTTRSTADGKPAMLQLAGMAGFRHTPSLSYGLGVALNIGLGQNWSNIRFTFEGLSLRSYASWQLIYGIGAYAGYERMYKQIGSMQLANKETNTTLQPNTHNREDYNESVLVGLTKTYRLNSKWNGAIQLLYDIWWQDKGLNSPVVLRFVTISK